MKHRNDSINAILEMERQRLEYMEYDQDNEPYSKEDYEWDKADAERDDW